MHSGFLPLQVRDQLFRSINRDLIQNGALYLAVSLNRLFDCAALVTHDPPLSSISFTPILPVTISRKLASFAGKPVVSPRPPAEGAGNAGRPMRPIAACAMVVVVGTRVSRSHRNHPTFPTQWLYGLWRALPGTPARFATVAGAATGLMPAWGIRTTRFFRPPQVLNVKSTLRGHRIPPHVCDDRETPPYGTGCNAYNPKL